MLCLTIPTRHNPDKMKEYAAQAMPIAFLATHEDVSTGVRWDSDSAGVESVTSQEMLETWEQVSCIYILSMKFQYLHLQIY